MVLCVDVDIYIVVVVVVRRCLHSLLHCVALLYYIYFILLFHVTLCTHTHTHIHMCLLSIALFASIVLASALHSLYPAHIPAVLALLRFCCHLHLLKPPPPLAFPSHVVR